MADRLYDYTNSREGVHQGQLFFGNKNSQLSAEDLRKEFEADGNVQLRNAFGSFDNYLAYMDERQDLIDSGSLKADWWDTGDPLLNPETGYEVINEGDPNVDYKEQMMLLSAGGYNSQAAMHDLYTKYTGQDITEAQTNEQGDTYRWNGTSYVKTFTNDGGFAKDFTIGLMTAAIGAAASPLLASKPGATGLGAGVSKGVAAGAINAGGQLALTGDIDPKSVLASGLIAGLNPGGIVADKYAPWVKDGELVFGGTPPSSFYGGLVSGTVNDLVSTGITEGKIDLGNSLEKGLISGGINSALNTWDEWKNNSQEAIADRLQYQDPYKYPDTEAGRALAMQDALNDPLLNTTDFGALIGDDGLLPFIPRADLGFLRGIVDPITDGIDGILNGFDLDDQMVLEDGTRIPMEGMTDAEYQHYTTNMGGVVETGRETIGLLNNPVVDGAANLLGGLLPAGDGSLSEDLQSQKDKFGKEWDDLYAEDYQLIDKNGLPTGQLTVAGQAAKNDYIQLKIDTLGSFYFENSGGLNENYSWSPNPRGQSELWGTTTGIPGLYSTGTLKSWLPDGSPGTVTPPLNPDGTSVTPILNLNPEIDPVGYAEYVASLDPSSAVLPSNDEAALRNWWLQQYYDYLNQGGSDGGDASVNLGVNTGVIPDTTTTNIDAGGDNVATTTGGADTNAGGNATADTGGNETADTGGNATTDTGGNETADTGGNATTGAGVDDPNNTGVNGGVVDSGTGVDLDATGQYGYYTAADGSQHPYNEYGAVILPSGVTISENAVNGALGLTDNWWEGQLGGDTNEPTQPGGGTLSGNGLNFGGKDGLPPVWTELFGYTKISPYQKARLKVLDGMLSGMAGGAVGNMNALSFGANRDPYQKIGKSLIDAGMEPRG